jgi:hypothetical protein
VFQCFRRYNVVSQNAVFTPYFALNLLEKPPKTAVFDDFDLSIIAKLINYNWLLRN